MLKEKFINFLKAMIKKYIIKTYNYKKADNFNQNIIKIDKTFRK